MQRETYEAPLDKTPRTAEPLNAFETIVEELTVLITYEAGIKTLLLALETACLRQEQKAEKAMSGYGRHWARCAAVIRTARQNAATTT